MYDVGGQRDERRKWMQVFQRAMAAIFVIDISCFDLSLREDRTKNRLLEAIETFEQAWNNRSEKNEMHECFISTALKKATTKYQNNITIV